MRTFSKSLIPLATMWSLVSLAVAGQPTVTQISGSNQSSYSVTESQDIPGGWNVLITIVGSVDEEWSILGEALDTISFSQNALNRVKVEVVTETLRFFSGIAGTNGPVELTSILAQNVDYILAADIGAVEVETFGEGDYLFVDLPPTILATGNISEIRAEDSVLATIFAGGDIETIDVKNKLNLFSSLAITVEGNIGAIRAGALGGNITVGVSTDSASGHIGRLEVAAPNQFTGGDTSTAWLVARGIGPIPSGFTDRGIFVRGDMLSRITLTDGLDADASIVVGGTLGSQSVPIAIDLPEGGLQGQIIANAYNDGGGWVGKIRIPVNNIDQELLPGYSLSPGALGGGAAGLAPFTMHESTASPANHHQVFISGIDIFDPMMGCYDIPFDDEITFRLYGPASIESGTGTPAKVQVRTGASTWTDAFDIDAEIVSGTGSRGLKFVRKDGSGNPIAWPLNPGEYRIVPKQDRILCAGVFGEPTVDFEYYIELLDGCELMLLGGFDLNNDDEVCMADMAEWMNNPTDLNGDETACSQDAALLLRAIDTYQNR